MVLLVPRVVCGNRIVTEGLGLLDSALLNPRHTHTVSMKTTGGCDPRIEAIVKLKSRGGDWVGVGCM